MKRRIVLNLTLISLAVLAMSLWHCTSSDTTDTAQEGAEKPALAAADNEVQETTFEGGPRISYPKTVHDFGTAAKGSKHKHKFIVRNIGDEPLEIIKAKGG
jgi:hypothetical protein